MAAQRKNGLWQTCFFRIGWQKRVEHVYYTNQSFFFNVYFETDNELSSRLTSSVCWRWFSLFSHHFCRWPLLSFTAVVLHSFQSRNSLIYSIWQSNQRWASLPLSIFCSALIFLLWRLIFFYWSHAFLARLACQSPTPKECNTERPSSSQQLSSLQSESHLFGWRRREEVVKQLGL